MIRDDVKLSARAVGLYGYAFLSVAIPYYAGEAASWIGARIFPLLLGFSVGAAAGVYGTRDQVRACRAAPTAEAAQFACPAWLR